LIDLFAVQVQEAVMVWLNCVDWPDADTPAVVHPSVLWPVYCLLQFCCFWYFDIVICDCALFVQRLRRMDRSLRRRWSSEPLQSLKCLATLNLLVRCYL